MGSKEILNIGYRDAWLFMGIKGTKSHMEKRGKDVNGGLILGYSRVTKRTRTKTVRRTTQTKSYTRTITRVVKKKITETKNGVRTTRIVTRTFRRKITCRSSRTTKSTKTTSRTTVN